jgi:hypothetical protein
MSTTATPQNADTSTTLATLNDLLKAITMLFQQAIVLRRRVQSSAPSTTGQEVANTALKSAIVLIEENIANFREVSRTVNVLDLVDACMGAGSTEHEALHQAGVEMEGWRGAMDRVEEEIAGIRASLV